MTGEQAALAQAVASAKHELRKLVRRVPDEIINGDPMRARAYKGLVPKAQSLLSRGPAVVEPYIEMTAEIKGVCTMDLSRLARKLYGEEDGEAAS